MKIKGLVLLIAYITALIFTGCNSQSVSRPDLKFDYEFEADISYCDETFSVICYKKAEKWNFTFTSPDEIKDMTVEFLNESYKINYEGLCQEGMRSDIPEGNICDFLAGTLEYISGGKDIKFTKKDDIITGKGVFEGGDLMVIYDKNRFPEEISLGKEIKIHFDSFKKS